MWPQVLRKSCSSGIVHYDCKVAEVVDVGRGGGGSCGVVMVAVVDGSVTLPTVALHLKQLV